MVAEKQVQATTKAGHVVMEHVDSEHVTTKQFLLDTINERDRKYEQRFSALDKLIGDANLAIKEALAAALASTSAALEKATANTQAALQTANENSSRALTAVDQRINQLALQQESFARKTEINQALDSMEKATAKAEQSYEKRFESVSKLQDQFDKFALQSEVNVKFDSLSDKVETIKETVLQDVGKSKGVGLAGSVFVGVVATVAALAAAAGVVFQMLGHSAH